jgi:hypothetical protein
MLGYFIGLTLPVVAAYPWVAWCDRRGESRAATFFSRLFWAAAAGWAIASASYFTTLLCAGPPKTLYCIVESFAFALVAAGGFAIRACSSKKLIQSENRKNSHAKAQRRKEGNNEEYKIDCGKSIVDLTNKKSFPIAPLRLCAENRSALHSSKHPLLLVYILAFLLASVFAVGRYQKFPLGDWDAWSMWNYRAKMFFAAGAEWRNAFMPEVPHNDYPLLLPCMNARLWTFLGEASPWSPWLVACLFTFGAAGLLTASVARVRGERLGLLAGLTLLAAPSFLREGTWQFADVPTSFFFLAAMSSAALFFAAASSKRRLSLLIVSGIASGAAAWTKNEGLMFSAVLAVSLFAWTWHANGLKKAVAASAVWLAAAAPLLALVMLQKACLAGENDLIAGQGFSATLGRLADLPRHGRAIIATAQIFCQSVGPAVVLLPALFWLLGTTKKKPCRLAAIMALSVFALMLLGYYLVCVTSPHELSWQLDAMHRLLMQIWPTGLLGVFLILGD